MPNDNQNSETMTAFYKGRPVGEFMMQEIDHEEQVGVWLGFNNGTGYGIGTILRPASAGDFRIAATALWNEVQKQYETDDDLLEAERQATRAHRPIQDNDSATSAFMVAIEGIRIRLATLDEHAADHFCVSPDNVTWSNVADAFNTAARLDEILQSLGFDIPKEAGF